MKTKTTIRLLALLTLLTASASVVGTISWFAPIATITPADAPIDGKTEGAYFAYGNGLLPSQQNPNYRPYGITKPRHLYNLAWLQYLGYFNKGTQYYFELADDIDMTGWVLPPIGTETNPFYGNFDGHGYVISNLTISNTYGEFNTHPAIVTSSYYGNDVPEIVGFFGVIGALPNSSYTYTTSLNEFRNTGLSGLTVKTGTTRSLIGLVAGYVNGYIVDVAVGDGTINIANSTTTALTAYTNSLSDYSVVGHCTDTYKGTITKMSNTIYGVTTQTPDAFVVQDEGEDSGWGGSVNMYDMYTKLDNIWKRFKKQGRTNTGIEGITYYANKTIYVDRNGQIDESRTVETDPTVNRVPYNENGVFSGSGNNNHAYYNYTQSDSQENKITSSYAYIIEENTNNEENYMCLTGKKDVVVSDGQDLTTHTETLFGGKRLYVSRNGTTYYMKTNGNNDVNATNVQNDASYWEYLDNHIYTIINGTLYYLNRSGTTTVNLSTNPNTEWTFDSSNNSYYTTYNNNVYYLGCNGTDWLLDTYSSYYYTLYNGSRYITHTSNNGTAGNSTTENAAARWYKDGNYYRTASTGTAYYLRYNNSNGSYVYVSNSTNYRFSLDSSNRLYATRNGTTYYIMWSNNAWTRTTSSANASIWTEQAHPEGTTTTNGYTVTGIQRSGTSPTDQYYDRETTEVVDATVTTNHTYFPLRQKDDELGVPQDTNTGYVVSGANYWGDPYGDIRVSRYSRSSYLNGYSNSKLNTVYTINANRQSVTVDNYGTGNFSKYTEAKVAMEAVLKKDTYIYGLHFMNADIHYGGTDPVLIEKAVINGQTYYDYEMPTDCVDFSLKDKGFINFFAGSYYSGNNSFFSLHEVVRSGNRISEIREIDSVYSDPNDTAGIKSYVYKYVGGGYSVPFKFVNQEKVNLDGSAYVEHSTTGSLPSGYSSTPLFSTTRIKQNSLQTNYAYYFEIPMNDGEYCLGSVSGCNGAYLMYLDIAANASKITRTIFAEHMEQLEKSFDYPKGVQLVETGTENAAVEAHVDELDSANMEVNPGYTGNLNLEREGDTVTATRTAATNTVVRYAHDDITYNDSGGGTLTPVPNLSHTTDIKRVEYYDYDPVTDSTTVTIVTETKVDNGTPTREVTQTKDGEDVETINIFSTGDGLRITVDDVVIPDADNNTILLSYRYVAEDGVTVTEQIVLNAEMIEDEYYYEFTGYSITITVTGDSITITVTGRNGNSYTITINGTSATNGATITVNPA